MKGGIHGADSDFVLEPVPESFRRVGSGFARSHWEHTKVAILLSACRTLKLTSSTS